MEEEEVIMEGIDCEVFEDGANLGKWMWRIGGQFGPRGNGRRLNRQPTKEAAVTLLRSELARRGIRPPSVTFEEWKREWSVSKYGKHYNNDGSTRMGIKEDDDGNYHWWMTKPTEYPMCQFYWSPGYATIERALYSMYGYLYVKRAVNVIISEKER